jgi:hypothetical protein
MDNNVVNAGTYPYMNVSPGTFWMGGTRYNLNGSRNVLGVTLNCPSQTSFSGKSVTFTYNSITDYTISWDGGTAMQLVKESGTATSASNHVNSSSGLSDYGIINDTAKSWPTSDLTNLSNPIALWIKTTGGTGSGQVRMIGHNTATSLHVIPAWTTVPDATTTYSIIQSDVKVFDSGGVESIRIGTDPRYLPGSTQTDTAWKISRISAYPY